MTTHRFVATEWHNVLGTLPRAFSVASGDTVITETLDAWGVDKDGVKRKDGPNPMNGPIFIEGNGCNGLAALPGGGLIAVCQKPRAVVKYDLKTKTPTVLAEMLDGKMLDAPNDVVVHRNGTIYFTNA